MRLDDISYMRLEDIAHSDSRSLKLGEKPYFMPICGSKSCIWLGIKSRALLEGLQHTPTLPVSGGGTAAVTILLVVCSK